MPVIFPFPWAGRCLSNTRIGYIFCFVLILLGHSIFLACWADVPVFSGTHLDSFVSLSFGYCLDCSSASACCLCLFTPAWHCAFYYLLWWSDESSAGGFWRVGIFLSGKPWCKVNVWTVHWAMSPSYYKKKCQMGWVQHYFQEKNWIHFIFGLSLFFLLVTLVNVHFIYCLYSSPSRHLNISRFSQLSA